MDKYRGDDSDDLMDLLYRDITSDVQEVIKGMANGSMPV